MFRTSPWDTFMFCPTSGSQLKAGAVQSDWLSRPHPALGGDIPREYLALAEGRELLTDLLPQLQSGAYI